MKTKQKVITYTYRGQVERGSKYRWADGYSETTADGSVLYPWMTRQECIADAKRQGARAQFYTPPGQGEKRFEPGIR